MLRADHCSKKMKQLISVRKLSSHSLTLRRLGTQLRFLMSAGTFDVLCITSDRLAFFEFCMMVFYLTKSLLLESVLQFLSDATVRLLSASRASFLLSMSTKFLSVRAFHTEMSVAVTAKNSGACL